MRFWKRRESEPPMDYLPSEPLEGLAWLELSEVVQKAAAHSHECGNREAAAAAIRQVADELSRRSIGCGSPN